MSARRREEEQPWQGEPGGSGLEPLDHCGPPPRKDCTGPLRQDVGEGRGRMGPAMQARAGAGLDRLAGCFLPRSSCPTFAATPGP